MPLNKVKVEMVEGLDRVGAGDGTNAFFVDEYVSDGVELQYVLSVDPLSIKNTQVYVSGVYQSKDTYTLDGTTITFSQVPPDGRIIEVVSAKAVVYESTDFVNVIGDTMTGDLLINADLKVRDKLSFTNNIDISHGNVKWLTGLGDPEGVISASVGSIYSDGSANPEEPVLFVKEFGNQAVGWVPAGTGSGGSGGADGEDGKDFTYDDFTPEQLEDLKGEKGDKGDKGDTGEQGAGIQIVGSLEPGEDPNNTTPVDKYDALLDPAGNALADPDDGHLWVSDGTSWVDMGEIRGPQGDKGDKGDDGDDGRDGESFDYDDFTQEQLDALKGEKGDDGRDGNPFIYEDFTPEQLEDLKGEKGDDGQDGTDGNDAVTTLNVDEFIGDGITKEFVLTAIPESKNNAQVYISGVYQEKSSYEISGVDLILSEAIPSGNILEVVVAYVNPMVGREIQGGGGSLFKGNNGTVGDAAGIGDIFRVNAKVLSVSATIGAEENASCAGPLEIGTDVILTVEGDMTIV